jgi:hypothetical protein
MALPKQSDEQRIKIVVDKEGNFSYDNPLIWVDRGAKIIWECQGGYPFAVHLGWDSPLDKGRYRASKKEKIVARVLNDARAGYYQYTVVVYDGEKIWTDDPELIVRRPSGG